MRERNEEGGTHAPRFLVVGRILKPWGVQGEVKVEVLTTSAERLRGLEQLYVDERPVRVESARLHGGAVLLKLEGTDSIEAAETLRGKDLEIPRHLASPLEEGQFYHYQIIGLQVVTTSGEVLGRVVDILETPSNDVYVAKGPKGEVLIPSTDDVIQAIDLTAGRVVIEPIEGLL